MHLRVATALNEPALRLPARMMTGNGNIFLVFLAEGGEWTVLSMADIVNCRVDEILGCGAAGPCVPPPFPLFFLSLFSALARMSHFFGPIFCSLKLSSGVECVCGCGFPCAIQKFTFLCVRVCVRERKRSYAAVENKYLLLSSSSATSVLYNAKSEPSVNGPFFSFLHACVLVNTWLSVHCARQLLDAQRAGLSGAA